MSSSAPSAAESRAQYQALTSRSGLVELGNRTQIEILGADRAAWLHNLCTNEVRKLPSGAGCEAFLTSVQGKTLAHVFLFAGTDSLVLETVPGEAEKILQHLDHYLVSERVEMVDRSSAWCELLLSGEQSADLLAKAIGGPVPQSRLEHVETTLAGRPVSLRRVDLAGPLSFLLSMNAVDAEAVRAELARAGAVPCDPAVFAAARIEWGMPLFGTDITDGNLPQEVARDAQAISFVKGCYLGQETVARIDALGHVNKSLVAVRFAGDAVPAAGLELLHEGRVVGQVTSAAYSPHLHAPLALAYLRRGSNTPGTRLGCELGEAEVVALPVR